MTVSTECDLELHKALEARANTAEPNNSSVDRMDQGWHLPVAMDTAAAADGVRLTGQDQAGGFESGSSSRMTKRQLKRYCRTGAKNARI